MTPERLKNAMLVAVLVVLLRAQHSHSTPAERVARHPLPMTQTMNVLSSLPNNDQARRISGELAAKLLADAKAERLKQSTT